MAPLYLSDLPPTLVVVKLALIHVRPSAFARPRRCGACLKLRLIRVESGSHEKDRVRARRRQFRWQVATWEPVCGGLRVAQATMGASWRRRTAWKMSMKSGSILCLWRPRPRTLSVCILLLLGLAPVSLLAQPISAFVSPSGPQAALGSSVTFCVTAIGQGPFGLQWQKNGVILPGQTNVCLSLTNIGLADGGSYRVTVFGQAGAVQSD